MRLSFAVTLAVAACGFTSPALGIVIDDFNSGNDSSGPGIVDVDRVQTGLPTSSVLGGGREVFLQYGGGFAIGNGALHMQYDQEYFEVAILSYSQDANVAPLNADLTTDGDDHLFIRVNRSEYLGAHDHADAGQITLFSGEGEASFAG